MKCIHILLILYCKTTWNIPRFPRYISCYIAESWLPLGQCRTFCVRGTLRERGRFLCTVLIQRTLCTLSNISNIYSFCTVYTLPLKVWRIAPILIRYMATHLTYVLGWHNGGPPNPTSRGRVAARLNLSSLGTFIEGIIIGGANNTQPHNKNLYFLEICFKCFLLYFINYQITRLK